MCPLRYILEEALFIYLNCPISLLLFSALFRNVIVSVRLQVIENQTKSSLNKQRLIFSYTKMPGGGGCWHLFCGSNQSGCLCTSLGLSLLDARELSLLWAGGLEEGQCQKPTSLTPTTKHVSIYISLARTSLHGNPRFSLCMCTFCVLLKKLFPFWKA